MLIEKADMLDAMLEQLKQSGARTNAEGFCDTAEEIEEDLDKIAALDAECEACRKCVGTGACVKDTEVDDE